MGKLENKLGIELDDNGVTDAAAATLLLRKYTSSSMWLLLLLLMGVPSSWVRMGTKS
jgi:hypothetical protein